MLGLTFAYVFSVLNGLSTEPIIISQVAKGATGVGDAGLQQAELLYFSFVTLSTLGYGDLTAVSLTARLVAGVEAIAGQLFLTILVARLIGLHFKQSRLEQSEV